MPKKFAKKKNLRSTLEAQLSELADQTEDLRHQVRDQATELRQQVVDRAPGVRDQIVAALPDKDQLLDLRDDLFDRLPENVQEKLPEKVKPKRGRLRKVAAVGVVTGAGAAAFAILKRKGAAPAAGPLAYTPPTPPSTPSAPAGAPAEEAAQPIAPATAGDILDENGGAPTKVTPTKKP